MHYIRAKFEDESDPYPMPTSNKFYELGEAVSRLYLHLETNITTWCVFVSTSPYANGEWFLVPCNKLVKQPTWVICESSLSPPWNQSTTSRARSILECGSREVSVQNSCYRLLSNLYLSNNIDTPKSL